MKSIERTDVALVISAVFLGGLSLTFASSVRQRSFEEVTVQASVVVLGRVVETPELGVYDKSTHHVYGRNRVQVEEYLKGQGPQEIQVLTFGGEFDVKEAGTAGPRMQFM